MSVDVVRSPSARMAGTVARVARSGAVPLLVSIIAIQGFTALAQLVVARVVSPSEFGIVRAVETVLSTLLLVASAGMPSLAIRDIAFADHEERPALLGRLVGLAMLTSIGVAIVATLGVRVLVPAVARGYLLAMIWTIALTAASRTTLNYFQGVQRLGELAKLAIAASLVSFLGLSALVYTLGLPGWVLGRYLGEVVLFGSALFAIRTGIHIDGLWADRRALWTLWRRGMVISGSLIVRTLLDGAATLSLAWLGAPEQVGFYGLAFLTLTPLLLLPSVIGNLAVPRLTLVHQQPAALRRSVTRFALLTVAAAVAGAVAALGVIPFAIRTFYPQYVAAIGVTVILVSVVPLRSFNMTVGALLMACDRNGDGLVMNAITLVLALAGLLILVPKHGAIGAAWAILLADVCSTAMGLVLMRVTLRRLDRTYPAFVPAVVADRR